jgi:hypothetical protein
LAKSEPSHLLTIEELDIIVFKVCAESGIKELPNAAMVDLCLKSWNDKFASQMNKAELSLAFEMNINGDFNIKSGGEQRSRINHYQCFSREYFCDVLNQYLQEKAEANKKISQLRSQEEELALPKPDVIPEIFEAIISDYVSFHQGGYELFSTEREFVTHLRFPTTTKLKLLSEIYEISLTTENIVNLRDQAGLRLIKELNKRKNRSALSYGALVSISHQIARIKSGKLLTQQDEAEVQAHVDRLLYTQSLSSIPPDADFVSHVRENIEIYRKQKQD